MVVTRIDGHDVLLIISVSWVGNGRKQAHQKEQELYRLFEAAPDLLEALSSLIDLLAVGDGSKEHQQYEPPEMKAARAAIAKAEGK